MSESMLVACVSAGGTLLVSIVTLSANAFIERFKSKSEIQQKEFQAKREHLSEVYKELIAIINLYPNSSPNDVLEYVEYAPNYSMKHFDSILTSLDYQIEDYKKQLEIANIEYERENDIREQILNREYAKKEISKIRDEYYVAEDRYKLFRESGKINFDLYAGQDVKNYLEEFRMIIDNVFISGRRAGDKDDPINNTIRMARRNLVNSMRRDIGIY